jgi:hypothetical protein
MSTVFFMEKSRTRKKIGRPPIYGRRMIVRREIGLLPKEARLIDSLVRKAGKSFNLWAREILLAAAGQ